MSDRQKSVTFIRVSSRLEASRSPVDGKWRAYALLADPTLSHDEVVELGERGIPLPLRWVVAGVAAKARDALQQAGGYLPKPRRKAAPAAA
jgi:hypothetical protein